MKRRILLIGVGLIGGSVALAIRRDHDVFIVGHDLNDDHCMLAKKLNIIDKVAGSIEEEAVQADVIILACPVEKVEQTLELLSSLPLKKGVIITDVGSTKAHIMKKAEPFLEKGITFIGGHPMAGSHKSGPGSARAHLFENAFYVLTPPQGTNGEQLGKLKDLLSGTKANFIIMDAEEHDQVVGVVSHLPHLIAASLVRQVRSHAEENERINWLAAGGFRDITRIASSSPDMWRDIVKNNRASLVSLLDEWMDEMQTVRSLVQTSNNQELFEYFAGAKKYRDSLPVRARGAIDAFYDLYVDVLDQPGVISRITTLLANEEISITNIRIIEARQDVFGVLRLSFQREADREAAKKCLEQNQFETYITD